LHRLKTDYLDLWHVHEVAYANDPERHFMKGGVIEALAYAMSLPVAAGRGGSSMAFRRPTNRRRKRRPRRSLLSQ
jgi:aryl-alcohol dehydrogenase-like predicted oxidoreductase